MKSSKNKELTTSKQSQTHQNFQIVMLVFEKKCPFTSRKICFSFFEIFSENNYYEKRQFVIIFF